MSNDLTDQPQLSTSHWHCCHIGLYPAHGHGIVITQISHYTFLRLVLS